MSGIGIPCKLMHEAEGHIVTVELKNGETYRGKLLEVRCFIFRGIARFVLISGNEVGSVV